MAQCLVKHRDNFILFYVYSRNLHHVTFTCKTNPVPKIVINLPEIKAQRQFDRRNLQQLSGLGGGGDAVAQWLRYYAISRKVAGSGPDEVNFSIYLILLTQPLTEMSTRNRKIMFLGIKVRPMRRADNLATICEPTV
jgi:hypothetical protein